MRTEAPTWYWGIWLDKTFGTYHCGVDTLSTCTCLILAARRTSGKNVRSRLVALTRPMIDDMRKQLKEHGRVAHAALQRYSTV